MTLDVEIRHRLGSFRLDVAFSAGPGVTALFGRSGSGKTSVVNAIAGLIRPDGGRIVIDGEVLSDRERGVWVPAQRRRIGYVFQEGRLFPHLSVRHNLLYGHWFTPRRARHGSLDAVVDLLGIASLLDRRPGGLSGGEKQRVAIGRALLASPRLLLMDEPLTALDAPRRQEILPYLERLRDESGVPIVYVSHAVEEVARLASTVVLLSDGRVQAVGPVPAVMSRLDLFPPSGSYEAGAVLEATVVGHDARSGLTVLRSRAGELRVPHLAAAAGARLPLRILARDVILATERPKGLSALNILPGTVAEVGPADGPIVQVRLDLNGEALLARITRLSLEALELRSGVAVHAIVKSVAIDRRGGGPAIEA